jgi:hypothetical protein
VDADGAAAAAPGGQKPDGSGMKRGVGGESGARDWAVGEPLPATVDGVDKEHKFLKNQQKYLISQRDALRQRLQASQKAVARMQSELNRGEVELTALKRIVRRRSQEL